MDPEVEQRIKEQKYRGNVLEAILVNTITAETSRIPAEKEIIIAALLNGIADYLGEIKDSDPVPITFIPYLYTTFIGKCDKYLNKILEKHEKTLTPKIRDALLLLMKSESASVDIRENSYDTCEAYKHLDRVIGVRAIPLERGTFPISYEMFVNAEKFLLTLSFAELENIHIIGKIMRKYFDSRKR